MTNLSKFLPITLLLIALLLSLIDYVSFQKFYHDDAFISLRYVQNFLHGHGLVWNPGERVEGYSNFLWVMLVSLLGIAGIDPVMATKWLGIGSLIAVGCVGWRFCRQQYPDDQITPMLAVLVMLSSLPMIIWSIGGLEPVLFALLLLLSIWQTLSTETVGMRGAVAAGLLFALLSMTRPDGPLYFVCALAWMAVYNRKAMQFAIAAFLLCFGSFLLWRYSYYGDWLPNPAYVKGTVMLSNIWRGLEYLRDYAFSLPYLLPLTLLAIIWLKVQRVWQSRHTLFLMILAAHLGYIVLVGGDHMPAFRFMVPIIPLSALLIADALRPLISSRRRNLGMAALPIIILLLCLQMIFPPALVARAKHEDGAAFLGRIVGEYINATFPKGSLIALNTAGSTPYYAPDHRFIDMLGLNDRTIAKRKDPPKVARWQDVPGHEKGDGKYVLSRKPDYIIAGGAAGYAVTMGWFLTEYELAREPEFSRWYTPEMILIPVRQYEGFELYEESETGEMGFAYYQRKQN
ncbi:MAG: hypothetical protein IPH75_08740 [bacterium]|nr:hypothetical protein [bacterium]